MGASAHIAFASGLFSLFLIVLYSVEARRGNRFGEQIRAVFDRLLRRLKGLFREFFPEINSHFLQELFYYMLHITLSRVLSLVRGMERFVLRVVRFNRMQALKLRGIHKKPDDDLSATSENGPTHLSQIAEHKEATKLTPREQAKRKAASLEGKH